MKTIKQLLLCYLIGIIMASATIMGIGLYNFLCYGFYFQPPASDVMYSCIVCGFVMGMCVWVVLKNLTSKLT